MTRTFLLSIGLLAGATAIVPPQKVDAQAAAWLVRQEHRSTRGHISREHNETEANIEEHVSGEHGDTRTQIEQAARDIIEALRQSRGEASSYVDKSIEASRRIADAAAVQATQLERQRIRSEAESGAYDPNPFSCLVVDALRSGAAQDRSEPNPNGSSVSDLSASWLEGRDMAVQEGGAALARSVVDSRDEYEGYNGSANATADWGPIFDNPSVDFSQGDNARVASLLLSNTIDALPPRPVSEDAMNTPEGVARAAERQHEIARNSLSRVLIETPLNMITTVTDAEPYRAIASRTLYNRPIGDRISELQQLDIRTVFHYAPNAETKTQREGWQTNQWLSAIYDVMSLQARMDYLSLELQNRQAIASSIMVADTIGERNGI